jgi:hypothetical protein
MHPPKAKAPGTIIFKDFLASVEGHLGSYGFVFIFATTFKMKSLSGKLRRTSIPLRSTPSLLSIKINLVVDN